MKLTHSLPADLKHSVEKHAAEWRRQNKVQKLWQREAGLWTGQDEAQWMGWLDIAARQQKDLDSFRALAAEVKSQGFEHALLLGMGGSSLCPEVFALTFGRQAGYPELHILDSTNPAQIRAVESRLDLAKTLCIVSSKSGSTLEPNILKQYFFSRMEETLGKGKAGSHFLAVTDPGSHMEQVARGDGFRHIFYGDKSIGGRYLALSNFGIVPAAVAGLDVPKLLVEAQRAASACQEQDPEKNPGVLLGLILGTAAAAGRDKLTFFASPEIFDLGAWLEQLIAESTGKEGKGITPVDREHAAAPEHYGSDRVFAYLRLENGRNGDLDTKVAALEEAGHPVVRLSVNGLYGIAQQFFTWEIATSVAGSVIGINPFNQPDVEAAKVEARRLTDEYEKTGKLAKKTPVYEENEIRIYADGEYADRLKEAAEESNLAGYLRAHLGTLQAGDYFATLAYLNMTAENEDAIQYFRHMVRGAKRVATCLGFGPRFQHSTGQDYKGGPNEGVFLQITSAHPHDLDVPGQKYTFGVVIDAQAAGDLAVLEQRGRRAMRVDLGYDVAGGLKKIGKAVEEALKG